MNRNILAQELQTAVSQRDYREALDIFKKLGSVGGVNYSDFDETLLAGAVGELTAAHFLEQRGHEVVELSPEGSFPQYDLKTIYNGRELKFEVKFDSVRSQNIWITYEYGGKPDGILHEKLEADYWLQVRPYSGKLFIADTSSLKQYVLDKMTTSNGNIRQRIWNKPGYVTVEKGLLIPEAYWQKNNKLKNSVFNIPK